MVIRICLLKDTDFPTNGSLHGLPVIEGNSVITSNWQETHDNLFRFNSSEINENYKSVLRCTNCCK